MLITLLPTSYRTEALLIYGSILHVLLFAEETDLDFFFYNSRITKHLTGHSVTYWFTDTIETSLTYFRLHTLSKFYLAISQTSVLSHKCPTVHAKDTSILMGTFTIFTDISLFKLPHAAKLKTISLNVVLCNLMEPCPACVLLSFTRLTH